MPSRRFNSLPPRIGNDICYDGDKSAVNFNSLPPRIGNAIVPAIIYHKMGTSIASLQGLETRRVPCFEDARFSSIASLQGLETCKENHQVLHIRFNSLPPRIGNRPL